MTQNKTANFWIRFLGRVIDFIIFTSILVLVAWPNLDWSPFRFKHSYNFYIWCLTMICLMATLFIVIPYFTKGATIGMLLLKIKIVFQHEKQILRSLLKRELFFGVFWTTILILMITVINHTMIDRYLKSNQDAIVYTSFEYFRISLLTTISSFGIFAQFICVISVLLRKNHLGLHDSYSQTKTVWIRKFIVTQDEQIASFKPHIVTNKQIKWIGE